MNVSSINSEFQSYHTERSKRVSRFDRLKSFFSTNDQPLLSKLHSILSNKRTLPIDKIHASMEFLSKIMQVQELSEWHLLRTIDYLIEYVPQNEMTLEFRAKIISCIFLYCHRHFKQEIECEVFEDAIIQFANILDITHHRDSWEKAISESIFLINKTHDCDLDSLLLILRFGVELIFHGRNENRDIIDAGPRKLVKDGIEKRLSFHTAERMELPELGLGFLQVYISAHQTMVYTPRDVEILCKTMVAARCSVYSIINLKAIVSIGYDELSLSNYQFYYACLKALGTVKFTNISDIEFTLSLIHKEFNHLKPRFESQVKIFQAIVDVMMNIERLDSPFKIEDIEAAFKEFASVFNIQPEWMGSALQLCKEISRKLSPLHIKKYEHLILCIHIMAKAMLGQGNSNMAKTNFCISNLCVKAAAEISGANLKLGQEHEAFDYRLIVKLIEESLCCLEINPQQTKMLQMIVGNPRLNVEGILSILEMLADFKKVIAQECLFVGLQHIVTQGEITLTQYARFLNLALHPNLVPKDTGTMSHADLTKRSLMRFVINGGLNLKWKFDNALHLYDLRRPFVRRDPPEPLMDHYFGEVRKNISQIHEHYGLKINTPLIMANWMESIVEKLLELRLFKPKSFLMRHPPLLQVKQELLNLLYEFCKLIEISRNILKNQSKRRDDDCIEQLYVRPEIALAKLIRFRIDPSACHEPEIVLVSGEFYLTDRGIGIPLLKIKDKEEM